MLTQTKHVDISHDDHLVMIFRKHGIVNDICQPVLVPFGHPHQSLGVSFRCTLETFPVGVFADALQHGADGLREYEEVGFGLGGGKVEALFG